MNRADRESFTRRLRLRPSADRPALPIVAALVCLMLGCGPQDSAVTRAFSLRPAPPVARAQESPRPRQPAPPERPTQVVQVHSLETDALPAQTSRRQPHPQAVTLGTPVTRGQASSADTPDVTGRVGRAERGPPAPSTQHSVLSTQ